MKMKMLALVFSSLIAQSAFAAAEVNVYSTRQDELIKPIIQQFEKETGIKVNVVFAKEGLNERLEREGKLSPADELNCGMCGYPSCREKAAAILAGKEIGHECTDRCSDKRHHPARWRRGRRRL